jgi:hypothetical protein
MPLWVLIVGIAAMVPCFTPLAAPASILLGQLTLMRLDPDAPKRDRNRVIIGTTLGYVSLVLLLLVALIWKLKGSAIRAALMGH